MLIITKLPTEATGASSGIGYAMSKLFAREGAKVVVAAAARRQKELDLLVDEINKNGGLAISLAGDVNDEGFSEALVNLATNNFGGVDENIQRVFP